MRGFLSSEARMVPQSVEKYVLVKTGQKKINAKFIGLTISWMKIQDS